MVELTIYQRAVMELPPHRRTMDARRYVYAFGVAPVRRPLVLDPAPGCNE